MTKEEFHAILTKPEKDCDGYEIHIQNAWSNSDSKSIFRITGLDFSLMFEQSDIRSANALQFHSTIIPRS